MSSHSASTWYEPCNCTMTGSSNLRLHPWRDSVEHCLRLLEASPSPKSVAVPVTREPVVSSIRRGQLTHESNARHNVLIRSVDLCFHETDYQAGVSNKINLVELFEAIAQLPNLESLIVRLTATASTFPHPPNGIPPLEALNIVLGSSTQLGYLTLIGLPLFADDFDMNGCVELLRIHPALHSIVVKDCLFASPHHLEQMKSATKKRKHVDYLNNVVVDVTTLPKEDVKPWYQSFFSTCFLGCM